jgi:hypothetical protein
MTTEQLNRRTALLVRRDAALARWPDRSGADYEAEMAAIAEEMKALAQSMDGAEFHPLERLRTWRCAGDAFLTLGEGHEPLQRAAEAFASAEALTDCVPVDATELLDLKYRFGSTLYKLSQGENEKLAQAAARHLGTALALARKHRPVGVADIKFDLFRAEHAVMKLTTKSGRSAARRENERIAA